ncbi:MAG: hypothetical protein JRI68_12270 [Deltaproteobacteria bacterium]|nr:hypothetical protein [Deltaproteobacteria bacterium]
MSRVATAALLALGLGLLGAPLRAEDVPEAEAVAKAARDFDEGRAAYLAGRFDVAASFFEGADATVPSPRALRMAIRARAEAGQAARAATVAGQALLRYPDHEQTRSLAAATIEAHRAALHRLDVTCGSPCVIAVGARGVVGSARKRWTIFADPGETMVSASFGSKQGADQQVIQARAGGSNALTFLPKVAPAAKPLPSAARGGSPPPGPTDPPSGRPDEPGAGDLGGDDAGATDEEPSWIAHPGVFIGLVVATAAVGGVTIWSGVDTVNEPGAAAVEEACVGQGTECPEYQDGLAKQNRTNALIGVTAGVGVITAIVGAVVTDWSGRDEDEAVQAAVTIGPGGLGLGLGGRF